MSRHFHGQNALPRYDWGEIVDATQPLDVHFGEEMFVAYEKGQGLSLDENISVRHSIITGGTGDGKSRLMMQRVRQYVLHGRGVALIDANNDTSRATFDWLTFHQARLPLAARTTFLLDFDQCLCALDPRQIVLHPQHVLANTEVGLATLRDSLVRDLVKMLMPKDGETDQDQNLQKRRRRTMRALAYALTTTIDNDGTYLPFGAAFDLIDPRSRRHDECLALVSPGLPEEYRQFFENLRALCKRNPGKIDDYIESTLTQLSDVLTPLALAVLDSGRPGIPVEDIVRRNGIFLGCFGKTAYLHEEAGLFFAKMVLRLFTNALRTVPLEERSETPFYIEIDEAQNYIDDDLLRHLKEARKFSYSCSLYTQEPSGLKKETVDLWPSVMNLCNLRVSFRMGFADDAVAVARSLFLPHIDFTPLLLEVERHGGYGWVLAPSFSQGTGQTIGLGVTDARSWQQGFSQAFARQAAFSLGRSESSSLSVSESTFESFMRNWSRMQGQATGDVSSVALSLSQGVGNAASEYSGSGNSNGTSHNMGMTQFPQGMALLPQVNHNFGNGDFRSDSVNRGQGTTKSESQGQAMALAQARSLMNSSGWGWGGGHGQGRGTALGLSHGSATQTSHGESVSASQAYSLMLGTSRALARSWAEAHNTSVTFSLSPLALPPRVVQQETGRLKLGVEDQFWRRAAFLASLPQQHCVVAIRDLGVVVTLRVADVYDPFSLAGCSDAIRLACRKAFVGQMMEWHGCFFLPPKIAKVSISSTAQNPSISDQPRNSRFNA